MSVPSQRSSLVVIRDAARAWRGYPALAAGALGAVVVQQLFFTGFAYSLGVITTDVTTAEPASALVPLLVLLSAGFVLAATATALGERAAARAGASIVNGIRRDLYSHLIRLSPAYFLTTSQSEVINRFTEDMDNVEKGYVKAFLDTAVLIISAAITVPLLFVLDWQLALITFALLPVVIGLVDRFLPRSYQANDALSGSETDIVAAVEDSMRAHEVVRTFHLEKLLELRFAGILGVHHRRSVRARGLSALIGKSASLGALLVQVIVIVVGAEFASRGLISIGSLVAYITVLGVLAKNVYDFAKDDLPLLSEAARGAAGVDQLMSAPVVVRDPDDGTQLQSVRGEIAFDRVSFGYTPDQPVLHDVSFEVPPDTTVSIVGTNGSGKSTVLSLLMRFYDPQRGVVRIDGKDLRTVTQQSFRSQMSVVLQGNFLFNDTIRENIRIGCPEASDEETQKAAKHAQLHDWVMSLPAGYDTVVGESGARLSGGQRQRLAVARALVRDPRLLLLDEVTTALDPATEASLNDTIARVGEGRTLISVTHRLATAQRSHQILVFDRGVLVERGTHDELLAAKGTYRSLWEKQKGFEVSGNGRQATVDAQRLRHIALLSDLDDATLSRIAGGLASEYYDADQVVLEVGAPGDRFYLIARGRVQVVVTAPDGTEHVLDTLGDGDYFGEMALLQDRPRTATVRTVTPSVFLTMGRDEFLRLVASTPGMIEVLEERMTQSELNLDEWRHLLGQRDGATDGRARDPDGEARSV